MSDLIFNSTVDNYDLTSMSLTNYMILMASSTFWVAAIFVIYEFYLAKIICLIMNHCYFRRQNMIELTFASINVSFLSFRVYLRNVQLCISGLGHYEVDEIIAQFNTNQLSNGKLFNFKFINCKIVLFEQNILNQQFLIESNSTTKRIQYFMHNSNFEFENLLLALKTSQFWLRLKVKIVSITESIGEGDSFVFIKLFHTKFVAVPILDKMKTQHLDIFQASDVHMKIYSGVMPFHIELTLNSNSKVFIDPWNELTTEILDFFILYFDTLQETPTGILRINFNTIEAKLCQQFDILFNLNTLKGNNSMELTCNDTLCRLNVHIDETEFKSFLSRVPLVRLNTVDMCLEIQENKSIKVNLTSLSNSEITLSNIIPNIALSNIILKQFKCLFGNKLGYDFILTGRLSPFKVEFSSNEKPIELLIKKVDFKLKSSVAKTDLLITFDENVLISWCQVFSIGITTRVFAERICFEAGSDNEDTKWQLIFSPIIFGENFLNSINRLRKSPQTASNHSLDLESSENLVTFNDLYLTVVQIRSQSFHNEDISYAKQIEVIIGDLFGSIDLEHLLCIFNLLNGISCLVVQENKFESTILTELISDTNSYTSFKLMTSLIDVNCFFIGELCEQKPKRVRKNSIAATNPKINSFILNMVISPIHFGHCDIHKEGRLPASQLSCPDLHVNILCSLNNEYITVENQKFKHKNVFRNLTECGSMRLNFMSFYKQFLNKKVEVKSKIAYLKSIDFDRKHLWFLWSQQDECACTGNCEFFSGCSNFKLYKFDNNFCYKPCIHWLNSDARFKVAGFGQSILVPNEMSFYSYKRFFHLDQMEDSTNEKKFIVLSNLEASIESDEVLRKKFEPFEIGIYAEELSKFLNEKLEDTAAVGLQILTSGFNSANMSPPYFSNEFKVYIRYLPIVRHVSHSNIYGVELLSKTAASVSIDYQNQPHSDLIDSTTTSEFLKTLKNFDKRLEKKEFDVESNKVDKELVSMKSLDDSFVLGNKSSIVTVTNLSLTSFTAAQPSELNSSINSSSPSSVVSQELFSETAVNKERTSILKKLKLFNLKKEKSIILNQNNNSSRRTSLTPIKGSKRNDRWTTLAKSVKNAKKFNSNIFESLQQGTNKTSVDSYLQSLPKFKFNVNQIDAGFKMSRKTMATQNHKKFSIKQVCIQSLINDESRVCLNNFVIFVKLIVI